MAAGRLPRPGTEVGPCEGDCDHLDCVETMRMAAQPCPYCSKPIGFQTRFYQLGTADQRLVHASCHEDAVEAGEGLS